MAIKSKLECQYFGLCYFKISCRFYQEIVVPIKNCFIRKPDSRLLIVR